MTLEYRCSNCGTVLQTTNADALHGEIDRLRAALQKIANIGGDAAGEPTDDAGKIAREALI